MKFTLSILLVILVSWGALSAETHRVPKDFKTIQEAINASVDGDLVIVKDGTYYENINFLGKKITVGSEFYLNHRQWHIRRTIINGSKPADPKMGSVVSFVSGEDSNSVLCGLTITGGTGTLYEIPDYPPRRLGGGILCYGSGAKIVHNRIINNSVGGSPWAMGGGMMSGPPFIPAEVIFENNLVHKNTVNGDTRVTGGGVDFGTSGRIVNNIFTNNRACAKIEAPAGGGLAVQSWDPNEAPPNKVVIAGNTIMKNKALQDNEATYWLGGIGGGLWIIGSEGVVSNNIILLNEISGANSSYGAGVLLDYPPDNLTLRNNAISMNYFSGSGTCYGGGLGIWDGNPMIKNNLISRNRGSVGGGVWLGYNFCSAQLINNTIADNQAVEQGGALNSYNSTPTLLNSILWGNKAPLDAQLCLESGTIDVSYCDITGGWEGDGNIDADPLLLPLSCQLSKRSPCVDAGHMDKMYNDPENIHCPEDAMLPARGSLRNDMGAYGGPGAGDWGSLIGVHSKVPIVPVFIPGIVVRGFPNPFNAEVTIEFTLPTDNYVKLKIFNILGQEVTQLVADKLSSGTHRYSWNANQMASGVYFYILEAGNFIEKQKLLLIK